MGDESPLYPTRFENVNDALQGPGGAAAASITIAGPLSGTTLVSATATSWLVPSSTDALSEVASTGVLASPVGVLVLASKLASPVGMLVSAEELASRTGPPLSMGGLFGLLLLEHAASNARPPKHTIFAFMFPSFLPSRGQFNSARPLREHGPWAPARHNLPCPTKLKQPTINAALQRRQATRQPSPVTREPFKSPRERRCTRGGCAGSSG